LNELEVHPVEEWQSSFNSEFDDVVVNLFLVNELLDYDDISCTTGEYHKKRNNPFTTSEDKVTNHLI
jgi:hypothetical protein